MESLPTYSYLLRGIAFFLLLSQLWVNTIPYCYVLSDNNMDIIELCDFWDNDSEEEDKKEKKEKEINSDNDLIFSNRFKLASNIYALDKLYLLANHSEINTPPPEYYI